MSEVKNPLDREACGDPFTVTPVGMVVVVGNWKWGKGSTIAEAITNGKFGRVKRGELLAYIFPGDDFHDIFVDQMGSVNWSHPEGWWPIRTEV